MHGNTKIRRMSSVGARVKEICFVFYHNALLLLLLTMEYSIVFITGEKLHPTHGAKNNALSQISYNFEITFTLTKVPIFFIVCRKNVSKNFSLYVMHFGELKVLNDLALHFGSKLSL